MEIILMQACHVPAVAALEKENFSDPWSENSIRSELTNPLSLWLVAVEGERVLGYIGSQTVLDEADMMNLAVDAQFRRRGLGRELVLQLSEELSVRGAESLSLEVRSSNSPAISLYNKMGFVQVGRRPNYYRNPKEDALILRKSL